MSRDNHIEEMARTMCNCYDSGYCKMHGNSCDLKCISGFNALGLYNAGYRKASEVAIEAIDYFQRTIRHIFLAMCGWNDYNTLNLLQIDSAIEALFDRKIAELKKKYTEGGK